MMTKYLFTIIAVLAAVLFMACSDDAAPADCIDAARKAGVPDRVIEWMKQPHESWGTIERIAIREALEKFGLGRFCVEVEGKLSLAESSAVDSAMELAKGAVGTLTPSEEPPAPTPQPTPPPPSTPLPAPTVAPQATQPPSSVPAPAPTPTAAPVPTVTSQDDPNKTIVTHVTYSGDAGDEYSRFIVYFNRPVVIDLPRDFDIDDDDPPIKLRVGYPYDGYGEDRLYYEGNWYDLPVSASALRSKRPTDKLSFGPVEREFAVAHYLVGDELLRNSDGSQAFDRSSVGLPGDTVFLNPGLRRMWQTHCW